jgi:glucose/arabinose dehydrogenase
MVTAQRVIGWAVAAVAALGAGPAAMADTLISTPVRTGLDFPSALAVAPDGRIFYGERLTGEIRVFDPASGQDRLFARIPINAAVPHAGLMSLAFHPRFPTTPYLYVSLTRVVNGAGQVQVARLTQTAAGGGTGLTVILRSPAGSDHNASRVAFGPDGLMYTAIGDAGSPALAQRLSSKAGKVLRTTAAGGIPAGNPWQSRLWARGLRNTMGMAFDPVTGRLWEVDNGPDCNDEVNRIVPGGNYGWGPGAACDDTPPAPADTNIDGPSPILPRTFVRASVGPTGAAFCAPCGRLGGTHAGALFWGAWNTGEIRQVTLTDQRFDVHSQFVAYTHTSGVLAVEADRTGGLIFSDTSGIHRLSPAPAARSPLAEHRRRVLADRLDD